MAATDTRTQDHAAAVLTKLLALGARKKLPNLSWDLRYNGTDVHGRCDSPRLSPQERRAAWEAWCEALPLDKTTRDWCELVHARPQREHTSDGRTCLVAIRRINNVQVCLLAEFWEREEVTP